MLEERQWNEASLNILSSSILNDGNISCVHYTYLILTPVVEYPAFLEHLLPVFELVLQTVPVQSLENVQHKIRYVPGPF